MGAIIILIIFTVIGYIWGKIYDDAGMFGAFLGLLIAGGILTTFLLFGTCTSEPIGEPWEVEQYKIQGLEDSTVTNEKTFGAFILGCGFVNSDSETELKYYYFKVNDIGKQLESITIDKYSNTYIRETNNIQPCLIYRYQKRKYSKFYEWLFGGPIESDTMVAKILVVPTETIKIEYNVDI